jgi:hypothetical protein
MFHTAKNLILATAAAQDVFLAQRPCDCASAGDLKALLACKAACGEDFPFHAATGAVDEDGDVFYWHGYVDEQGVSRLAKCKFTEFVKQQITDGVPATQVQFGFDSPLGNNATMRGMDDEPVRVIETAIWTYDASFDTTDTWHTDPRPHLLVFISGEGEWTTQTGTVRLSEGALYLGDDHLAKEFNGHGHFSRSSKPGTKLVHLNYELDAPNTKGKPCWLH